MQRALAVARDGVLTRDALASTGLHRALGDYQVGTGAWTRLAPSTYLVGTRPPTDAQLVLAARAHAGPAAVITGAVACRALGLVDVPEERAVEVLVAAGRRLVSTQYVVVHQTQRPPELWVRGDTRYACTPRAVVDAARRDGHLQSVRALLLGVVCSGACTAAGLRAEVEAGCSGGSAVLRRAVRDATAGAWSAPEAEAADLAADAARQGRLPPFVLNAQLLVNGAVVGRPDGYVVGTGVGWQVDSRRHHGSDLDLDQTLAVHDRFAAAGVTVLHVTPRRLRRLGPAWVDLLAAAAAAGRGDPVGLELRLTGPLQPDPPARKIHSAYDAVRGSQPG